MSGFNSRFRNETREAAGPPATVATGGTLELWAQVRFLVLSRKAKPDPRPAMRGRGYRPYGGATARASSGSKSIAGFSDCAREAPPAGLRIA